MALLDDCFCCSLGIASGFFAVYLLVRLNFVAETQSEINRCNITAKLPYDQ